MISIAQEHCSHEKVRDICYLLKLGLAWGAACTLCEGDEFRSRRLGIGGTVVCIMRNMDIITILAYYAFLADRIDVEKDSFSCCQILRSRHALKCMINAMCFECCCVAPRNLVPLPPPEYLGCLYVATYLLRTPTVGT